MIPEAPEATSVCVSVVLHNSAPGALGPTLTCLHSSLAEARKQGFLAQARVVLRDNASDEAYRREVRSLCDSVFRPAPAWLSLSLDLSADNPGFGVAHNRNLDGAAERLYLILNPDVELASDAIAAGIRALQSDASVIAINPLCKRAGGQREYLCKRYPSVLDLFLRGFTPAWGQRRFTARLGRYEYRGEAEDTARPVELLSGACLLCRAACFRGAGGFDPHYFLYFEDFDLSLRLRELGDLRFEPTMLAVHHGGFAAKKGWRHRFWFIRSAIRFFHTHGWRLR
jgi:GT2 family glycosyltransferase